VIEMARQRVDEAAARRNQGTTRQKCLTLPPLWPYRHSGNLQNLQDSCTAQSELLCYLPAGLSELVCRDDFSS
jgi:hypothetical protein